MFALIVIESHGISKDQLSLMTKGDTESLEIISYNSYLVNLETGADQLAAIQNYLSSPYKKYNIFYFKDHPVRFTSNESEDSVWSKL